MIKMVEQNNIQAVYVDNLGNMFANAEEKRCTVDHIANAYVKGVLNELQSSFATFPAGDWCLGEPVELREILHDAGVLNALGRSPLTAVIAVDDLGRLPREQLTILDRMREPVARGGVFPPVEPIKT